ncbi:MAG: metal ABC transporter ATP-binding protein [Epulopiscium sp.]|jgi:zinc transport system ATP-binding protein|nr:metal ABC transporter ATP-binding protein [Candidatus Epulonipiscium sp.]
MSIHNRCGLCRIDISNLSVYSGEDILIENINMDFHCGQLTALIGKNGAGKTTLIRAILGERKFTGKIRYQRHDNQEIKRPITGYVPQQLTFDKNMPVSVMDFMLAGKKNPPVWLRQRKAEKEHILKRLEQMHCAHVANRKLGELSGGELQRVLLTAATDPMPDLLILDEPASGVDAAGLDLFYKTVSELRNQYHMAILLVSHDLDLIRKYADKVVLINKTVIEQGEVAEVFATDAFRESFGR